jgi:hypothetical protein
MGVRIIQTHQQSFARGFTLKFLTSCDILRPKQLSKEYKEILVMEINELNWEKLKAMVHYVSQKASDPSVLGAVKLNKVLWYADTIHYLVHGAAVTGEQYVKRERGPVPCHILRVVQQLVDEGKVARGKVDYFGFTKSEYIALTDVDISGFSATEISIIDSAFDHVCLNHTATSVSDETHGIIWQLAQMGEEIPYHATLASTLGEIDEEDMAWADSILEAA